MMIGPMKKKVVTASVVTAVILIVVFAALAFLYISNNNKKMALLKKESEVVERFVISGDVLAGQVIDKDNIKLVKVKAESAPLDSYYPEDKSAIIGRRIKVNAMDKTIVTDSLFFEEDKAPNKDLRLQEYNMITLPSNLNVGDYIDIRARLSTGEDYIVLVGKRVEGFGATGSASNTIFLRLNEEDIVRMSSAVIESYIDPGINLYANRYVDPSTQLFDYSKVDLVAAYNTYKYDETAGEFTVGASGEVVQNAERRERTNDELAEIIGVDVSEILAVRDAIENNDEKELARLKSVTTSRPKSIETTYPVRAEVATLIARNPNILEEVKQKYDIARLEEERVTFKANEEILPEDKEKANELISTEIQRQRAERQQYLLELLKK